MINSNETMFTVFSLKTVLSLFLLILLSQISTSVRLSDKRKQFIREDKVPFLIFHQHGVTRDLFRYIVSHIQNAGLRFTDIEHLFGQMYYDLFASENSYVLRYTLQSTTNGIATVEIR